MNSLEKIISLVLAILFFIALMDMPYGYYQFIRFLALVGFGILAYNSHERQENVMTIVYASLAILFQPLFKISLGRELWNAVDVIVGIGLIASIFIQPNKESE